jgi:hypothetical protein
MPRQSRIDAPGAQFDVLSGRKKMRNDEDPFSQIRSITQAG